MRARIRRRIDAFLRRLLANVIAEKHAQMQAYVQPLFEAKDAHLVQLEHHKWLLHQQKAELDQQKAELDQQKAAAEAEMTRLETELADHTEVIARLDRQNAELGAMQSWGHMHLARLMLAAAARGAGDTESADILNGATTIGVNVTGSCMTIAATGAEAPPVASYDTEALAEFLETALAVGEAEHLEIRLVSDRAQSRKLGHWAVATLANVPHMADQLARRQDHVKPPKTRHFGADLACLGKVPELAAFAGAAEGPARPPFHDPKLYPITSPARPKRRSAVFLHNNYYHYNCLSEALRKRGWDTVTVSLQPPDAPDRFLFHGEDINLFADDYLTMKEKITRFFATVPERFGNLHFYGRGVPSFYAESAQNLHANDPLPYDFLELRRHRLLIGTMPSGCLDGGAQSSINKQGRGVCDRCVWQLHPETCSDVLNLEWNSRLQQFCDWIGLEEDHQTPERVGPKFVADPLVTCLDPERWHPDLEVPEDMRHPREKDTVLIYHAVGNYEKRRKDGRDIKGTGAVLEAIDTLKSEGLPVDLIFAHDVESTKVRYLQVQADIVVDQLNYGRYGANAREALMLGRPTITRLIPEQAPGLRPQRAVAASPLVNASEATLTDVLRDLVLDKTRRIELGAQSRSFALNWHAQDVCAERFERFTDAVANGTAPADVDVWPTSPHTA